MSGVPTIPRDVEARIGLEHLGRSLHDGWRFQHLTLSQEQARNAIDAAYQEGWRAGVAAREAAEASTS